MKCRVEVEKVGYFADGEIGFAEQALYPFEAELRMVLFGAETGVLFK